MVVFGLFPTVISTLDQAGVAIVSDSGPLQSLIQDLAGLTPARGFVYDENIDGFGPPTDFEGWGADFIGTAVTLTETTFS
jgi:hypothetical protein